MEPCRTINCTDMVIYGKFRVIYLMNEEMKILDLLYRRGNYARFFKLCELDSIEIFIVPMLTIITRSLYWIFQTQQVNMMHW